MTQGNTTAATAAKQPDPKYAGWRRKVVLFLSGQTISLFGSSLVQFAIVWYITLSMQSGSIMTVSSICAFAPQVVIALFQAYGRTVITDVSSSLERTLWSRRRPLFSRSFS